MPPPDCQRSGEKESERESERERQKKRERGERNRRRAKPEPISFSSFLLPSSSLPFSISRPDRSTLYSFIRARSRARARVHDLPRVAANLDLQLDGKSTAFDIQSGIQVSDRVLGSDTGCREITGHRRPLFLHREAMCFFLLSRIYLREIRRKRFLLLPLNQCVISGWDVINVQKRYSFIPLRLDVSQWFSHVAHFSSSFARRKEFIRKFIRYLYGNLRILYEHSHSLARFFISGVLYSLFSYLNV